MAVGHPSRRHSTLFRGRLAPLCYKMEPAPCFLSLFASSRVSPWPHHLSLSPPSLSRAVGHLQPPLLSRLCAGRPRRRHPRPCRCIPSPGIASVSRGDHRRHVPAGNQWR
ncbi:Os11g0686100 [Oryza sativa Japonica Group]|uniref:Os11g0686100 protein n=1 Tax=Oryza sativa subsp. japonica TaxID=39947 RepID=C7J9D7_ORYSJ|nr:Os11g0686100 [Oryza sativa Japonica Group]|eukprot:NP_001176720.1 Os11g0686100 [Oryza sativa Japonica Group]